MNSAAPQPERLAAPEWFVRAIAQPTLSRFALCEGARIYYRCWNEQDVGKAGLLFVHGYRGHTRWWDFIAPFFTETFRVLAMDFYGMGESDRRERYALTQHGAEIRAVIEHARLAPATVVGHSYGGSRLLRLCAEDMPCVGHADLVGRRTPYPDRASALARFRLVPDQYAEPQSLEPAVRCERTQASGRPFRCGEDAMKKWMCGNCGWIYDEEKGDPASGLAPGTRWDDVPETWVCPDCGAEKSQFEMAEI